MKSRVGEIFVLPSGNLVKVTYEGKGDLSARGDRASPDDVVGCVYVASSEQSGKQVHLRQDWFNEYAVEYLGAQ